MSAATKEESVDNVQAVTCGNRTSCRIYSRNGFAAPPAQLVIDTRSIPLNQPPLVEDNVIMVPFRPIFEASGWTVTWNNEKKTATALLGKRIVQVTVGQNQTLKPLSDPSTVRPWYRHRL